MVGENKKAGLLKEARPVVKKRVVVVVRSGPLVGQGRAGGD